MNENPSAPGGTLHKLVRQGNSTQLEIAIQAGGDPTLALPTKH